MNTKTCKKCGWVYPVTQKGNKCLICGELFDVVVCCTCGEVVSGKDKVPKRPQCKKCHNAQERAHMKVYNAKRKTGFVDTYSTWLARIAQIPKNYPALTEAQWLKACNHFNGCAQCGSANIDARGFFIQFSEGGRYCDWNIVPTCTKCSSELKKQVNPFRLAWTRDNMGRSFNNRKCLAKIEKYLGGIIDDAIRATEVPAEDAAGHEHDNA